MALPTMSGRVAKDFGRVSVRFWELQERQGGVESPPGPPPGPPPGSLLGGQQGGFAPTTTRREIEAKRNGMSENGKRKTPRTRRQVGGFFVFFGFFGVGRRPEGSGEVPTCPGNVFRTRGSIYKKVKKLII